MVAVTDDRPRWSRPVKDRRKSAMENNIFNATARVTRELTVSELDDVHGGASALAILAYGVIQMGLTAAAVGLTGAIAASKVNDAL
jgi:hypothetical protein